MKQIMLAQTEEYSNSSSYYINGCSTESLEDGSSSDEINGALFGGDDIIADDIRYEMCIESTTEEDGSSSFNVVAVKGDYLLLLCLAKENLKKATSVKITNNFLIQNK